MGSSIRTDMKTELKISLEDLQGILYKMNFYRRKEGYIAHDLSGKLCFFNSEPSFGGAFVTKDDILSYIKNY